MLNDKPAIFLTCKHKRYADIYFALLHELAHCKSDFNRAKSGSIVSTIESETEDYEIKKAKEYNNDAVKSFLAYRLAKDKIISYSSTFYQQNNPVIDN